MGELSEVKVVEAGAEGLKEVVAKVLSVAKNCECRLCRKAEERARFEHRYPRWHIVLRPEREGYRDFHVWITADSAYAKNPATAGKGTQLGDYVERLKQLGMRGGIVDELLADMLNKSFLWERVKIGRMQRETWTPKQLLSVKDPIQACAEQIANTLERGRAYTVRDTEAAKVSFPSDIIAKAWDLLVQKGKAYRLPTKPEKWFFEG